MCNNFHHSVYTCLKWVWQAGIAVVALPIKRHSYLEFLVQHSSKEVQHNKIRVGALASVPAISQQTGHEHKLLHPCPLSCIYQM